MQTYKTRYIGPFGRLCISVDFGSINVIFNSWYEQETQEQQDNFHNLMKAISNLKQGK